MRRNYTQNIMAELENQIKTAFTDDEGVNTVLRHGQQAAAYSVQQNWRKAAAEYERIAQLSAEMGDVASEALGYYGQGMCLQKLGKQPEAARQAYTQAATLAKQVGHRPLAAKSHHLLASLNFDKKDFAGADFELTLALEQLEEVNEPELTVLIYRTRAGVNMMRSRFDQAKADLNSALSIAQHQNNAELVRMIQHDQQGLMEAAQFEQLYLDLDLTTNDLLQTVEETINTVAGQMPERGPEMAVHMSRLRAGNHLLRGQIDQALDELEQALATAQKMDDKTVVEAIEGERQKVLELQQLLGNTLGNIDLERPFESLFALTYPLEQQQIAGDPYLHQAYEFYKDNELELALEQAETAQQAALQSIESNRYNRYLLSCLLIAEIKEKLDDKPGVLFTLLTGKATLEKALGPESSRLITLFLDSLQQRWGAETLQKALRIYRQRAAQMKTEGNTQA